MDTIARFVQKIKLIVRNREFEDIYVITLVITTGAIGFFLGRISINSGPGQITKMKEYLITQESVQNTNKDIQVNTEVNSLLTKQYLASKNGTKYYMQNCSGINRILEENKIWFDSEEDAQTQGYTKSSTCK